MRGLDGAELLQPGHGQATLGAYVSRESLGASLTVEARVHRALAAYAEGRAGYSWATREIEAAALGGLRVRW